MSIIIDNYNYSRFLRDAINSALRQTYPFVEVIVVDDGSTDNSREIIAEYGDCIKPILKGNEGQASAFNAGFAASKGDIIIFLDADDVLLPEAVEEVVKVWDPKLAKIQWRLRLVNEELQSLQGTCPHEKIGMPSGKILRVFYHSPPTSGNAFSRWLLEDILPMPNQEDRFNADIYLISLAVLYGDVHSIDSVLGYYRIHGSNWDYRENPDIAFLVRKLRLYNSGISITKKASLNLGMKFSDRLYPAAVKLQMALAVLAPEELEAMGQSTNRLKIACNGVLSLIDYPYNSGIRAKLLVGGWFLVTSVLPRAMARRIAILGVFPALRPVQIARFFGVEGKLSTKRESNVR